MAMTARSPLMQSMTTKRKSRLPIAGPMEIFQWFHGVEVPDPITFVVGEQWLNRPNLYPRQATMLKIIFLRDDLFTEYDHQVIAEWIEEFDPETNPEGIQPDIYERIAKLKSEGRRWFREVLLAVGRRGGKGYISALAMAYILWTYMAKGDPQDHYGIDRDKKLTLLVFAGKRDQAKENLWRDIYNVITGGPCFAPYVNAATAENLTVYAPHDFVRIKELESRGILPTIDMATFQILPRESTSLAGRGPASFILSFDEMAHVVKAVAKADAGDVYNAATPSLDQFGKDGFIVAPSSTWQMLGKFYELWQLSLERDELTDEPMYPEKLMIQLSSWGPYMDWEDAHRIPMFPADFTGDKGEYVDVKIPTFKQLKSPVQAYDEQMRREERANPDTFRVERRSRWATALDAYLNERKVDQIFQPWTGRPSLYGRPELQMQSKGLLITTYKAHGDPAEVNCRFGFAVAHEELVPDLDAEGKPKLDKKGQPILVAHAVFDKIHHWDPADYEDHTIDYDEVLDWIWDEVITKFHPEELTFDQFNNVATIQRLKKRVRREHLPKRVNVFEKTATAQLNWTRFEQFKAAINMGLVHAPEYTEAKEELKFLTKPDGTNRVDHPTSGPVQTKDIADCMVECVHTLLGEQMNNFLNKDLRNFGPHTTMLGGIDPMRHMEAGEHKTPQEALAGFNRSRGGNRSQGGQFRRPRGPRRGRGAF
jgi:hypothetical protein